MHVRSPGPGAPVTTLARLVDGVVQTARRGRRAVRGTATVGLFAAHGDHFEFDPDGVYSYASISVGHHVNLGAGATLLATRSHIRIGDHVMFGPGVTIRGGNHRADLVGHYLDEVGPEAKRPRDDLGVVIEDDVWVGGNATILHGVVVGRGSVIGAAAVVTRSVPPYSIVGGNPARVIRARFTEAEIADHEAALGRRGPHPPTATSPVRG